MTFENLVRDVQYAGRLLAKGPVLGERVSGSYFSGLGAKLLLGRPFTPEEDVPGGPRVAVLSEKLWRQSFGADPGILGRSLRLNGDAFTVVGGVIFIVAGLLALGLACMGIYGVISYSVRQRVREMAIRMSLGAQRRDVLMLVIRESIFLVGIGIGIGLLIAFPIMTFVGSFLYGISSADPLSFLSVVLLLTSAALAATYPPAKRATSVDPMIAMRFE